MNGLKLADGGFVSRRPFRQLKRGFSTNEMGVRVTRTPGKYAQQIPPCFLYQGTAYCLATPTLCCCYGNKRANILRTITDHVGYIRVSASTRDLDCRQFVDGDFIVRVMAVYGTLISPPAGIQGDVS